MKKIILLLIITNFCFSQNKDNFKFSAKQIDSLSMLNGSYSRVVGRIESNIEKKKKRKISNIIGTGGFSIQTYLYHYNEPEYNRLSKIEKRKYNFEKYSKLIKGYHHQVFHYKNSYSENIDSEFYYQDLELFYFKIKIIRSQKNEKDKTETFEYNMKEFNESKSIKNEFMFELKTWVKEKNKQILKVYNQS